MKDTHVPHRITSFILAFDRMREGERAGGREGERRAVDSEYQNKNGWSEDGG